MLFVLFINDMPKVVSSSKLSLFADDAKCYRKVLSHSDCKLIELYLIIYMIMEYVGD